MTAVGGQCKAYGGLPVSKLWEFSPVAFRPIQFDARKIDADRDLSAQKVVSTNASVFTTISLPAQEITQLAASLDGIPWSTPGDA